MGINIDSLRQLLKDPINNLSLSLVRVGDNIEVAQDGSSYQINASTIPDDYECLLTITQDSNLEGGIISNQIWLAGFIENNLNNGFLINRIVNDPFPLHPKAMNSETVLSSNPKKRINLSNDRNANLTENAVLGQELKRLLTTLINQIRQFKSDFNNHKHTAHGTKPVLGTPPAPVTRVTGNPFSTDDLDNFLSDLVYIQEKGLTNSPD